MFLSLLLEASQFREIFLLVHLTFIAKFWVCWRWARLFFIEIRILLLLLFKVIHSPNFRHWTRLRRTIRVSSWCLHTLVFLFSINVIFIFIFYNDFAKDCAITTIWPILGMLTPMTAVTTLAIRLVVCSRHLLRLDCLLSLSHVHFIQVDFVSIFILESTKRPTWAFVY